MQSEATNCKRCHSRFQFRIWQLMIGVAILGPLAGVVGRACLIWRARPGHVEAANVIEAFGGQVIYARGNRVAALSDKLAVVDAVFLTYCAINDEDLQIVEKLPWLRFLDVSGTDVSDRGVVRIARSRRLISLGLSGTFVTDRGVSALSSNLLLESLDLEDTDITDDSLVSLSSMRSLRHLKLGGSRVTAAGVRQFRLANPTCSVEWLGPTLDWRRIRPVRPRPMFRT